MARILKKDAETDGPTTFGAALGLLFLFLVAGSFSPALAADPPSKYDPYLNSVMVIQSSEGVGTGFFISSDGLAVTNHHVVGQDNSVQVKLRSGRVVAARVLQKEKDMDLALISVPGGSQPKLSLARPEEGGVGADVIAIGTPKGLSWTVSKGIISGLRDGAPFGLKGRDHPVRLIQTDAAINTGNSGGPLILLDSGRVVGVNTLSAHKDVAEGISFAVSSANVLVAFADRLYGDRQPSAGPQTAAAPSKSGQSTLKAWLAAPGKNPNAPPPSAATSKGGGGVVVENDEYFLADNDNVGRLLVITGSLLNKAKADHAHLQVRAVLQDKNGLGLTSRTAFAGNILTDRELGRLSPAKIKSILDVRSGRQGENSRVRPNESVPFMIVFDNFPRNARKYDLEVIE